MRVQPSLATSETGVLGFGQKFAVKFEIRAIGGWMPQMKTERPATHIQASHASIHQAYRQFRIFASPTNEGFIITVNPDQVLAPQT